MKRFLGRGTERLTSLAAAEPGAEATGLEVLRWALAASVARVVDNSRNVTLDADAEVVHQSRVGTRRFRSTLRTFRGLFDPAWADGLRARIKPLADDLGAVRDADVMSARLTAHLDAVDDDVSAAIAARLEARRRESRTRLMTVLASPSYAAIVADVSDAAMLPHVMPGAAADAAAASLMPYVAAAWRRLHDAVTGLADEAAPESLHRVRILTKRARYAAETLAPVTGRSAERFARRAASLQDVLGELQDATSARAWLATAFESSDPAPMAFGSGILAGLELAAADRAREEWPAAWRRLRRKKATRWLADPWAATNNDVVVFLVRHAKAGDRTRWTQADEIRPLTGSGLRQASGLVELLSHAPIAHVASSPYTRCMQTVEPLAAARKLPITPEGALAEGAPVDASVALLDVSEPTVLCTHGDVAENVIGYLAHRNVPGAEPSLCEKGSTWVLWMSGSDVRRADYLPPQA